LNGGLTTDRQFEDTVLPHNVDVVVVGAGISGIATAIVLCSRGARVAVCEKGIVAGEQSSRALGWVASMGDTDGRIELSVLSKRIWEAYAMDLGLETTYRRSGLTTLCYSEDEVAKFESWKKNASSRVELDAHALSRAELSRRLGVAPPSKVVGAFYQASDGGVDPRSAASRLAAGASNRGVTILERCAVRGIETSAGCVSGVITEAGTIRTTAVVVAAGIWSRLFCGNLGIDLPVASVYGTAARLVVSTSGPVGCGATDKFGWHRHLDGTYTFGTNTGTLSIVPDSFRLMKRFLSSYISNRDRIKIDFDQEFFRARKMPRRWSMEATSPFEVYRALASKPDPENTERSFEAFREFFGDPAAKVVESWGAVMDSTPDRIPIIGPVVSQPGLYICTGFSGHGLAMAPAAGQLVAEQILGLPLSVSASPYRLARFTERGDSSIDVIAKQR
jgi:glycine/D-amino acid oxidase-like deaminating enzyme